MIQEKALTFAKELIVENFPHQICLVATLEEKKPHNFHDCIRESKSVRPGMIGGWGETSFLTLLSNDELKDIYYAE